MTNFGPTLRQARAKKNMSLRVAAKSCGISATYLSMVERGQYAPPSKECIKKLCEVLGLLEDEILLLAGKQPGIVAEALAKHGHDFLDLCVSAYHLESLDDVNEVASQLLSEGF